MGRRCPLVLGKKMAVMSRASSTSIVVRHMHCCRACCYFRRGEMIRVIGMAGVKCLERFSMKYTRLRRNRELSYRMAEIRSDQWSRCFTPRSRRKLDALLFDQRVFCSAADEEFPTKSPLQRVISWAKRTNDLNSSPLHYTISG